MPSQGEGATEADRLRRVPKYSVFLQHGPRLHRAVNFDGHNFTAAGGALLTGANYTGIISSPGVTGTINGTFYGPKAAQTGGNFAAKTTVGPTYLASGIFAGKK